jgi:hypothetical protein
VEVAAATAAGGGGCWAPPLLARVRRTRVASGGDWRVETRLGDISMYPSPPASNPHIKDTQPAPTRKLHKPISTRPHPSPHQDPPQNTLFHPPR